MKERTGPAADRATRRASAETVPLGTTVVIMNPIAGRGLVARREREILGALVEAGLEFTPVVTKAEGHATELAREAVEQGADTVVAVGGDGTVHEVARGMWDSEAVLGAIPMGSGNDFTGCRGIPEDLDGAIAALTSRNVYCTDVGFFNGRPFFNTIGLGFSAAVTAYSLRHTRLRGYVMYLVTVLESLYKYRSIPMVLTAPEYRYDDLVYLLTIGIGTREGGGFTLLPDAEWDDGLFDCCLVHDIPVPTVLRLLPRATTGKHTHLHHVTMLRKPSLTVEGEEPILLHADGQITETGVTEIEFTCAPRALRFRAP